MRFHKRNRSPLLFGRMSNAASSSSNYQPVENEERNALIFDDAAASKGEAPMNQNTAFKTAADQFVHDPTQRLLTALGRFQREVIKAKESQSHDQWPDECMNQLINAVEIALTQGWSDVVEALTETGRILQSYEEANQVRASIPFLEDSYEILCLMVGDLIVGSVRTGVIKKWRSRYQQAVGELRESGIPLIQDDDDASSGPAAFEAPQPQPQLRPKEVPEPSAESPLSTEDDEEDPFGMPSLAEIKMPEGSDELPSLDELPPLKTEDVNETKQHPPGQAGVPSEEREAAEAPSHKQEVPAQQPQQSPAPESTAHEPSANAEPAPEAARPSRLEENLDQFCEALLLLKQSPDEAEIKAQFHTIEEALAELRAIAQENQRQGAETVCEKMQRICAQAHQQPGGLPDDFFDIAYAFSGLYAEAGETADERAVQNWIEECEVLLLEWDDTPATPAETAHASEAAQAELTDESPFGEMPELDRPPKAEHAADGQTGTQTSTNEALDLGGHIETEPAAEDTKGAYEEFAPAGPELEAASAHPQGPEETTALDNPEEPHPEPEPTAKTDTLPSEPVEPGQPESVNEEAPLQGQAPDPMPQDLATAPDQTVDSAATEVEEAAQAPSEAPAQAPPGNSAATPSQQTAAETPESIMTAAQQAMAQGDTAGAKVLLLKAAASFAKVEAEQAAEALKLAEQRLQREAESISRAMVEVQEAEEGVVRSEERVAEGRELLTNCQSTTTEVHKRMNEVQVRLAGLEEQLRELQAKRDEVAARLQQTETELEETRAQEATMEAELKSRREAEEASRRMLEDTRQQVKNHQRRRTEIEAEMERAREQLRRKRESFVDLQETIAQFGMEPIKEGGDPEDWLF